MKTPSEQKNESVSTAQKLAVKEVVLPSGLAAKVTKAKGKHVVEAQRLMDGNPDLMLPALLSVITTTTEGRQFTLEEILELDYLDYMQLLSETQGGV